MNISQLNKAIQAIGKSAASQRDAIQAVLPYCAYQTLQGNTNPFNELLEAVGKGTRKEGIVKWAENFGFVKYEKEKLVTNKSAVKAHKEALSTEQAWQAYQAEVSAVLWYDIPKKEQIKSQFNAITYLETVVKHLTTNQAAELAAAIQAIHDKAKRDLALQKAKEAEALANA